MAKAKNALVELPPEPTEEAPVLAELPRWRVALNCPTPLTHKELVVEGRTEEEAKQAFCAANGISDSIHPWTVERLS